MTVHSLLIAEYTHADMIIQPPRQPRRRPLGRWRMGGCGVECHTPSNPSSSPGNEKTGTYPLYCLICDHTLGVFFTPLTAHCPLWELPSCPHSQHSCLTAQSTSPRLLATSYHWQDLMKCSSHPPCHCLPYALLLALPAKVSCEPFNTE